MTEKQWNEFIDKLDFAELTGRWNLLPLHWLDEELPDGLNDLSSDLAASLLELREVSDEAERLEQVKTVCREYRRRLSGRTISLDSRLTPPGSRVTLSYLDLQNLGEGDCLITLGAWDRVGYSIAETAHPGAEHTENVGESPVRQEPGELKFRHLLLFPDKGTPSPRSFRALCEKTLRQARGLGARTISMTHLHLPQTGLADRFAAAEVVSAVRQMLRESPGVRVDILTYTHRNFEDYEHWFESLKSLTRAEHGEKEENAETPPEGADSEDSDGNFEVGDTLRNFAKRSSDFANEATASVKGWFSQATREREKTPAAGPAGLEFTFAHRQALNTLYLKREVEQEWNQTLPVEHYLLCLAETVRSESLSTDSLELRSSLKQSWEVLGQTHPLSRYYRLLDLRLQDEPDQETVSSLLAEAKEWDDRPLVAYLQEFREDPSGEPSNRTLPPVYPAGSRTQPWKGMPERE
ncbi:MAG: hypothetical protein KC800_09070 [Candidatus Eremiobacteraeota bacterium]|nr:hypothetical protein [Candidatus Eremiobacteraeota bacterium]